MGLTYVKPFSDVGDEKPVTICRLAYLQHIDEGK
jgi:hypothetical protein